MKISGVEGNGTILKELGRRIKETRIASGYTQTNLADMAGISRSSITRLEGGESSNVHALLNVLRTLSLLENVDLLVPEQEVLPTERVDHIKKRKRAVSKRKREKGEWKWGDEE